MDEKIEGKLEQDVLSALLSVDDKVEKDVFMRRFNVDFHIKALDGKMVSNIRKQCEFPQKNAKTKKTEMVLDEERFALMLIKQATVIPNWADPKLLQKYNTSDAVDVIQKRLLAGEQAYLSTEIMDISGFNDDSVEQVKN